MSDFTRLEAKHIAEIAGIVPDIKTGSEIHEDYFHDELAGTPHPPEAVVRPRTTAQVSALMKWASETGVTVVPQGGNTGMVGGQVPVAEGKEIIITRQGCAYYSDDFEKCGENLYRQVGVMVYHDRNDISYDTDAVTRGHISITPMSTERTDLDVFHALRE